MNRRSFLTLTSLATTAATLTPRPLLAQQKKSPNFLIIMVDDMGYGDISHHGGETPTPHINSIFTRGVELEHFMVWAVCSPTRAGLLTGINPLRIQQGPLTEGYLDTDIMTFGKAFQAHDYKTGIFGKWHNSLEPISKKAKDKTQHVPINNWGFDRWVGFFGGGIDMFTHVHNWEPDRPNWWHDDKYMPNEKGYAMDLLTKHANNFITENKDNNFVCYVPFNAMHGPLHAKMEDIERVPKHIKKRAGGKFRTWKEYYAMYNNNNSGGRYNKGWAAVTGDKTILDIKGELSQEEKRLLYSAMMINLDDNVGKLLDNLKAQGLDDNTAVFFFSDNGGVTKIASNAPFQGGKHSIWEGGVHSLAAVNWPGGGLTGGKSWDGLMGYLDIFPTMMDMAGLPMPKTTMELDGKNCYPALKNDGDSPVDSYYFLWRDRDMVRTQQYKLFRDKKQKVLYDVIADVSESKNIAAENPAIVEELEEKLHSYVSKHGLRPGNAPARDRAVDAAPENPILEISFQVAKKINHSDKCLVELTSMPGGGKYDAGDTLEYDIKFAKGSDTAGFHISTIFKRKSSDFLRSKSVDINGQPYTRNYSYPYARGKWRHYATGIGQLAPKSYSAVTLFITDARPGTYHFYLDNIIIRHKDGSASPFWRDGIPRAGKKKLKKIKNFKLSVQGLKPRPSVTKKDLAALGSPMLLSLQTGESQNRKVSLNGMTAYEAIPRPGGKPVFVYFKAPKNLRNGKKKDLLITVVYRDKGMTTGRIAYDSDDQSIKHKRGNGTFKKLDQFNFGDHDNFVKTQFKISDALFSGRCNGDDLRLEFPGGQSGIIIQGIYLQ